MEANNLLPFSPGARIEEVRERYERQNFAVAIDPLDHEQAFRADFKSAPLNASVGLGCGYSSPHVARRSSTMAINAGIDGVRFSQPFFYTSGPLSQAQFNPGDTLVAPMDVSFECLHPTAGSMQALWVRRDSLPALLNGPAQHVMGNTHLDLLFGYAASIQRQALAGILDPRLSAQTASHLVDLLALGLGAAGDLADQAHQRGERSARLAAMKAQVARCYQDPLLSVVHLAQQHHMSVRQVQRLFEEDGTTFTAVLQNLRLAHVHRALADPALEGMRIVTLAHDAGFSDLPSFNRLFKRRYGASPGQLRASWLGA